MKEPETGKKEKTGKSGYSITTWRSHQNYEAVLEDDKGQIYITEGLENTFKPVDLGTEQEIQVIRR